MSMPTVLLIIFQYSNSSSLQKNPEISHNVIKTPKQAKALEKNITRKFQICFILFIIYRKRSRNSAQAIWGGRTCSYWIFGLMQPSLRCDIILLRRIADIRKPFFGGLLLMDLFCLAGRGQGRICNLPRGLCECRRASACAIPFGHRRNKLPP